MSSKATMHLPFTTILIANRGEIAIRLIRAVQDLNLRAAAIFVSDDSTSRHVRMADVTYNLGSSHTLYSNTSAVLSAANTMGAEAVLPGYGFISENPDAAAAFERDGIVWLGPTSETINLFGLKHTSRQAARKAGVPVVPGSSLVSTVEEARNACREVGFPTLLKATAGGGGMGQAIVRRPCDVDDAYKSVRTQASALFSTSILYCERFIEHARHIEVQIFGDGSGKAVALGDRDCSVQRRRQKVIEEASAPDLPDSVRSEIQTAAVNLCAAHNYRSAGTVEFILDAKSYKWFFLEVNTRLQVEHGITEMVSGIDIVQSMILLGAGMDVLNSFPDPVTRNGISIEARIYAENPINNFIPSPGTISEVVWPDENTSSSTSRVRVDKWAERGTVVGPNYDPLLGKVIAWGPTRPLAIIALQSALSQTKIRGVDCNVEFLLQVLRSPHFLKGKYTTGLVSTLKPRTRSIEVLNPGIQSSLQDYPGRVGLWNVGVSPSGPMDAYAMGMANALVGNPLDACALEITFSGPTLRFHCDAVIALTGATFKATLNDNLPVRFWTPFHVSIGSILTIGDVNSRSNDTDNNLRCGGKMGYIAIRGGIDAPRYLGSASTFPSGKFGGLNGSFLTAGVFLPIGKCPFEHLNEQEQHGLAFRWPIGTALNEWLIPSYDEEVWTVAALNGPHGSPDFLSEPTLRDIWSVLYKVHHATNRLGARLIGPAPKWARSDGGSAGLHPSNLHDYTYAPGAVNFSGNTPIVLMQDGPSLGGFVCPITVATADLWKIAQAVPGDSINFKQIDFDQALVAVLTMEEAWEAVRYNQEEKLADIAKRWSPWWIKTSSEKDVPAVLAQLNPSQNDSAEIKVEYRMSGDEHILIEYGEIDLDLAYRLRVHMLMVELEKKNYVKELCPGVRSLLVRYNRKKIHPNKLITVLVNLENGVLGSIESTTVPSRVIKLPLAFNDQWTKEAQARYLQLIRPNAPYMPSNVDFIRRINGLDSIEEVAKIMTSAEYMVLGLGDVYLGAPCAVPVDPRHRLVTSKYNPARTYTPEGAVGIGGVYMCIYGMDSPGGYQLTGRTLPIWDSYGSIPQNCRGSPSEVPWLLRFFDRVKFFPVKDDELENLRNRFLKGDYIINISEETFSYAEYKKFLITNHDSIESFRLHREKSYAAERARWEAVGEGDSDAATKYASRGNDTVNRNKMTDFPDNAHIVVGKLYASIWSVHVVEGDIVQKDTNLVSLESMKVEINVESPVRGKVHSVLVKEGDSIKPGSVICVLIPMGHCNGQNG